MDALTTIRAKAAESVNPLLARKPYHWQPGVVREFALALTEPALWPVWMDVPVRSIVGLHHMNFVEPGASPTWLEAAYGLDAKDWDDRVFRYWDDEIKDADFPATGARRALRLDSVAGAVVSDNGVHRLIAGLVWKLSTEGSEAVFRSVRTVVHHPRVKVMDAVLALCNDASRVEVAALPSVPPLTKGRGFIIRASTLEGRVVLAELDSSTGDVALRPDIPSDRESKWEVVPTMFVHAWRERSWVKESLTRGQKCPTLTA